MTRVVITGLGACTSVGNTVEHCFSSFVAGYRGNTKLKHLKKERYNNSYAYERSDSGPHNGKFRSGLFLQQALLEAIGFSGISRETELPVYVGTGLKELRTLELSALEGSSLLEEELNFTKIVRDILPNSNNVHTLTNACSSSNFALGLAFDKIQLGDTDIAIVAGCDTVTSSMFGLLDRSSSLQPDVIRVFDDHRQGVLMGDGGVALIIESLESAIKNNRTPVAEIASVGMSCDAFHETAPNIDGITIAIEDAYQRGNIVPSSIDLIYVHGTGTSLNDLTESTVLKNIFRDVKNKPAISGIKSMTGHTSGASGAIGVISAVKSIETCLVPPTPGTKDVIDEASDFLIYQEAQNKQIDLVQVNAFGFGGVNAVVIIKRYEGKES